MGGTVYGIAGGKGGVGKTATALNVGVALAQRGYRVALVDADLSMTNLGQRVGLAHEPGIHDVLADEAAVSEALVEGPNGMAVLMGARDLESYGKADPEKLREVLDLLRVPFDVVLVDTGPGVTSESHITHDVADGAIVVTTAGEVAVSDAERTARFTERVDCPVTSLVVQRIDDRAAAKRVGDRLDVDRWYGVPDHPEGHEQPAATAPASGAATAYRRVAHDLPVGQPTDETEPAEEAGVADIDGDALAR
jgi:septum site-determining protein MinD